MLFERIYPKYSRFLKENNELPFRQKDWRDGFFKSVEVCSDRVRHHKTSKTTICPIGDAQQKLAARDHDSDFEKGILSFREAWISSLGHIFIDYTVGDDERDIIRKCAESDYAAVYHNEKVTNWKETILYWCTLLRNSLDYRIPIVFHSSKEKVDKEYEKHLTSVLGPIVISFDDQRLMCGGWFDGFQIVYTKEQPGNDFPRSLFRSLDLDEDNRLNKEELSILYRLSDKESSLQDPSISEERAQREIEQATGGLNSVDYDEFYQIVKKVKLRSRTSRRIRIYGQRQQFYPPCLRIAPDIPTFFRETKGDYHQADMESLFAFCRKYLIGSSNASRNWSEERREEIVREIGYPLQHHKITADAKDLGLDVVGYFLSKFPNSKGKEALFAYLSHTPFKNIDPAVVKIVFDETLYYETINILIKLVEQTFEPFEDHEYMKKKLEEASYGMELVKALVTKAISLGKTEWVKGFLDEGVYDKLLCGISGLLTQEDDDEEGDIFPGAAELIITLVESKIEPIYSNLANEEYFKRVVCESRSSVERSAVLLTIAKELNNLEFLKKKYTIKIERGYWMPNDQDEAENRDETEVSLVESFDRLPTSIFGLGRSNDEYLSGKIMEKVSFISQDAQLHQLLIGPEFIRMMFRIHKNDIEPTDFAEFYAKMLRTIIQHHPEPEFFQVLFSIIFEIMKDESDNQREPHPIQFLIWIITICKDKDFITAGILDQMDEYKKFSDSNGAGDYNQPNYKYPLFVTDAELAALIGFLVLSPVNREKLLQHPSWSRFLDLLKSLNDAEIPKSERSLENRWIKKETAYAGKFIANWALRMINSEPSTPPNIRMDLESATDTMIFSKDTLEITESMSNGYARCSHKVKTGKWYFEVTGLNKGGSRGQTVILLTSNSAKPKSVDLEKTSELYVTISFDNYEAPLHCSTNGNSWLDKSKKKNRLNDPNYELRKDHKGRDCLTLVKLPDDAFLVGDVIGFYLDLDNKEVFTSINGCALQQTSDKAIEINGGLYPGAKLNSMAIVRFNFGDSPFKHFREELGYKPYVNSQR